MTHPRSHRARLTQLLAVGAVAGALGLLLAACGTGPIPGQAAGGQPSSSSSSSGSSCSASDAQSSVTIDATDGLKFVPATACLKVGGTVTWKNTGSITHTTTDDPSKAANAADAQRPPGAPTWNHQLPAGTSFSLKLTKAGTYKYFCIPHETLGMLGQITVVG
ncbi:MAG: cupredoxin domain-containing protein [Candidatus Dormibacteria bacterium]